MFKLLNATINKYKSYSNEHTVELEPDVTTLVGKNESGKTAFLEALAKINYFTDDSYFQFNETSDYPRNELKKYQRSGDRVAPIICTFQIDEQTILEINEELGEGVFASSQFTVCSYYNESLSWYYLNCKEQLYLTNLYKRLDICAEAQEALKECSTVEAILSAELDISDDIQKVLDFLNKEVVDNGVGWTSHYIDSLVIKKYLKPRMPRFWYFDEYHGLPARISIDAIKSNTPSGEITRQQLDTAKALFELSMIDVNELDNSDDFESFISELEATSNEITDNIFEYWSTNSGLSIEFKIEFKPRPHTHSAPEKILNIRVKNEKHRITLPLNNRSKGFNWFFSFIVWFSKIQDDKDKNFILLLDEPGLNLHASAQEDLLRFINDLSKQYQVVYSTHSPFMIESDKLNRVRTVYDGEDGSVISEAIQEKDPATLFPLQAALGYDIAQNLFISKNNLLVEGPADLNYLTYLSNLLESEGRTGLKEDITIVPVGGLDKVSSFISLLHGSKLKIACLLDTFNNQSGSQRIAALMQTKIIKEKNVMFFDQFIGEECEKADIEDLFTTEEYLKLFTEAFPEYKGVTAADLDQNKATIILKLNKYIGKKRFNHFKPSHALLTSGIGVKDVSEETLDRFESMFKQVNALFN